MIDRNLQISYVIVDNMHTYHPELLKDRYWNELPSSLPDRAKSILSEDLPKRTNDADVVDYHDNEPRSSNFEKEIENKMNTSYFVIQVKEPSNLVPNSEVISSAYWHLENVEQEQNVIQRAIERQNHSNGSYSPHSLRESMDRSDKHHK